jgi:drug/metabolite transporter (DMT)-like permease
LYSAPAPAYIRSLRRRFGRALVPQALMNQLSSTATRAAGASLLTPLLMMLTVGTLWGLTFSFAKAASEAGIGPLAYTFWQTTGAGSILLLICLFRREPLRLDRAHLAYYLICGFLSLAVPNVILQTVIGHVPAGVTAIIVTTVPLITYAIAMGAKLDRFALRRALGLFVGFLGALVLIGPQSSLPDPAMAGWVLFGFLAPLFYASGNVYVAKYRPNSPALPLAAGMLCGAAFWQAPVIFLTNGFQMLTPPFNFGEWGVIGQISVTSLASILYFEIVRRAGPVFFSQTAYVVTLTAILWAMAIFGERHSWLVWAAAALIASGVALVNLRSQKPEARNQKL